MFKNMLKRMAGGERLYYYMMSFFDVPNTKGETEVIHVEVVASGRDEAEKVAREALGKDNKPMCRVTQITEVSIRSVLDLKDELQESLKLIS